MADPKGKISPMLTSPITRESILRVLVLGFGLVILLLVAAGFFGVRIIESIRNSVARLEEEQAVTARLVDEIEDEQAALSALFYKLARDPESVDREAILADLEQTDRHIDRIVAEVSDTSEAPLWRELKTRSSAFAEEARRLLGQENATTLLSRDLFHRHDQVVSIVGKLIEASNRQALEAQNQIRLRSRELLQRSSLLLGGCLVLAMLCAVLTVWITTGLFRKMEWQASELSRISWHLLENQESTARRFSHELHDELGQSLTAIKANLLTLKSSDRSEGGRWGDCIGLVEEAIRNVRELSQLLRPIILDDFGLDASLRWLCDRFTQRTGIDTRYESNFTGRLPDETETHMFRIAQEALTNVARHSGATRVQVNLLAQDDKVRLTVEDNGRGLPADWQAQSRGLGIVGMGARARSASGELTIGAVNGQGVRVTVEIPNKGLKRREEARHEEENPHPVGR